jgi:TRAP-type C4-dicarboxylate transport system permease small subunit
MASSKSVLENNTLFSRLDRALEPLERFFALLSGLGVFSLMFLAAYSVSGRKFFGSPMLGYVDYIEMAMPLIAFMGVSYVQRDGTHIRMDILIGQLKGRALWLFELISVLLILFLIVMLIWGSWAHFERSFDFSVPLWSRDSSIDVGLPLWPAKLIVPVAFSVFALRLVLQAMIYTRALITDDPHPAGVPMILSIEEQARIEADQLQEAD